MQYIYLHGLFSGPGSSKGLAFQEAFQKSGHELLLPDLNVPDFFAMTLSTQMAHVSSLFAAEEITLIGSSLGGLVATLLAEREARIKRLVLMAPAFGFIRRYLEELGAEAVARWRETGAKSFFHYGLERELPWSSAILEDLPRHPENFTRELPVLICHGLQDDVVPYADSVQYLGRNRQARLLLLHSDHQLHNALPLIIEEAEAFCRRN